ncbi:hypothetical protein KFE25_011011 [Diacronema lutheri]|uniref:Uncharacterized protein n=1 Tax=Diacronema lutheri TaxID=2081491 RepID=A0A8J5XFM0_DIALT|nr:hypothetical protein KFE25_011011 [Diacronema lutheri]
MRTALARRASIVASSSPSAGDVAMLEAVGALQRGATLEASALLRGARDAYRAAGGASASQLALLDDVEARVRGALVREHATKKPDPLAARTVLRKLEGDEILQEALRLFNAKEYAGALEAVQRARESFTAAGASIAADRETVVGNLYSLVSREAERQVHNARLLKIKELAELKRQRDEATKRTPDMQ